MADAGTSNSKPGSRHSKPRTPRCGPGGHGEAGRRHGCRGPPPRERRRRGRTVAAVVLVVVALLLAPVAVISAWARIQLVDTDQFVATFAPLAEDPAVQAYIGDQVTAAIEEQVDIPALTSDLFDGIKQLDLPPRAEQALGLLEGPPPRASSRSSRASSTGSSSRRPSPRSGERRSLAATQAFVAAVQGDPDAALAIGGDGTVSVQLGPIIEAVKDRLEQQGVGFAANIPVVERSIVIAQNDAFVLIQTDLRARGRRRHVAALDLPRAARGGRVRREAPHRGARVDRVGARADHAAPRRRLGHRPHVLHRHREPVDHAVRHRIGALRRPRRAHALDDRRVPRALDPRRRDRLVLRTWRPARAAREFAGAGFASARKAAARHGVTTGSFGIGLDRWRGAVYIAIALIAAAVVLFNRPVTVGAVIWTVIVALIAVVIVELLRRPADEVAAMEAAAAAARAEDDADAARASDADAPTEELVDAVVGTGGGLAARASEYARSCTSLPTERRPPG